jgi:hypothetical protein
MDFGPMKTVPYSPIVVILKTEGGGGLGNGRLRKMQPACLN